MKTTAQKIEGARDDSRSAYATKYSASWIGRDGREWRSEDVWCNPGWRSFLAVKVNGKWQGW